MSQTPGRPVARTSLTLLGALAMLGGAGVASLEAQGVERHQLRGSDVAIYNLVGQVTVQGGTGDGVNVELRRAGEDASRIRVETGDIDGRKTLRVIYPDDRIVYREMSRMSRSTLSVREDGTFGDGRGGERVTVTGGGSGMEAWADMTISVPNGQQVAIYLGVGKMSATNVNGRIRLATMAGSIAADGMRGTLKATSGSGSIRLARASGDLALNTGSGSVDLIDVEGERLDVGTGSGSVEARSVNSRAVRLHTGSGSVRVSQVRGGGVDLDTGSGGVTATGVSATDFRANTGSGDIRASAITAPTVKLETGSGSVDLQLDSDVTDVDIETGSGGVRLGLPANAGAELDLETGSGGINVEFPTSNTVVRKSSFKGRVGDGNGLIRVDTGSGGVRVVRRS